MPVPVCDSEWVSYVWWLWNKESLNTLFLIFCYVKKHKKNINQDLRKEQRRPSSAPRAARFHFSSVPLSERWWHWQQAEDTWYDVWSSLRELFVVFYWSGTEVEAVIGWEKCSFTLKWIKIKQYINPTIIPWSSLCHSPPCAPTRLLELV